LDRGAHAGRALIRVRLRKICFVRVASVQDWAVLPGASPPDLADFAILAGEIAVLLFGGIMTFHKIDAILADRI
jgi:hypothetical protein